MKLLHLAFENLGVKVRLSHRRGVTATLVEGVCEEGTEEETWT